MRMPSRTLQRRDWKDAFTLVELLVVIGIIGVLIGILLPVLSKVRERSTATKCASNLRNLGQAWQLYATNNNGTIAPGRMPVDTNVGSVYGLGRWDQYRPRWYELLGDCMKQYPTREPMLKQNDAWQIQNEVFLCAARPEWRNSRNYPYGYNYQFLGNARAKNRLRQRDNTSKDFINYPVKATSVRSAAQTVLAADCMGTAAGKGKGQRTAYLSDGTKDEFAWCNKGWCLDPPRLTQRSDYADPQHRRPMDRSGPDPRHGGMANVLFCDGHVENLTPQQMGYAVAPDGAILVSGAGAHNRMFSGSGADEDPPPAYTDTGSDPQNPTY